MKDLESNAADAEVAALLRQSVGGLARRLRATRPDTGVSLTGLSILGLLYRRGAMTPSALAGEERIQPQSLTRVLAALEEKALIARQADPTDRRQVIVHITDTGRRVLREDARLREAWLRQAIARLSPTEREVLRLAAGLMEQLGQTTGTGED